jgi:hypothetical protein
MANIPLPERGQPIDLTYIYSIAEAVNRLSENAVYSANKFLSVDTPGSGVGRQDLKITESRVIGAYEEVTNAASNLQGSEIAFSHNFEAAGFKYPPVVTATPVNISGTEAGKDVTIVLTSISSSRVDGVVKFGTSGVSTVGVSMIAIGVPA